MRWGTRVVVTATLACGVAAGGSSPGGIVPIASELEPHATEMCDGEDCAIEADAAVIDLLSYHFPPARDTQYMGHWEGDVKSGNGMETTDVGKYQGEFADGKRHGLGEFIWQPDAGPAGAYKGFWADGQMDGLGALTFGNGDRFFGMWKMGAKQGEGFYLEAEDMDKVMEGTDGKVELKQAVCVYDDGSSYTGQIWAPHRVSAEVTRVRRSAEIKDPVDTVDGDCHWVPGTDGSLYEFVKPHGRGVIMYTNGDRYAGEWQDGRPHGTGMIVTADGQATYGVWDQGNLV